MESIAFNHDTHRRFFFRMLRRSGDRKNPGTRALFYVQGERQLTALISAHHGIGKETRNHIDDLYDWKRRQIRPEALDAHWQTDQSMRTTLTAFHLWNGHVNRAYAHLLTPHALFAGNFASLYAAAIKLRYPELFRIPE